MSEVRKGGQGARSGKAGSHRKAATVGSGGQRRRRLEGRGPTPPASERTGHPASRPATADPDRPSRNRDGDADRGAAAGPATGGRSGAAKGPVPGGRGGPAKGPVPGGRGGPAKGPVAGSASGGHDRSGARGGSGRRGRSASPGGAEWVSGRNPVVEALRARVPAVALYVVLGAELDDRLREALRLAAAGDVPIKEVTRPLLDRQVGGVHQGLALKVPPYAYASVADLVRRAEDAAQVPLLVALDGVTDPHNLGAVVRSAAAFGGHGVLVPQRRSAGVGATAWKASAGALARLPVAQVTNLARAIADLKDLGLLAVGLDGDGAVDLEDLEVAVDPLLLVVGSEGKGLSRLVARDCDLVARIPMAGRVESLNASVAAGVALAEIARRRRHASRL